MRRPGHSGGGKPRPGRGKDEQRRPGKRAPAPKTARPRPRSSPRPTAAILDSQPWDSLTPLLPKGRPAAETIALLRRFCSLVLDWNQQVSNLISKNDEARIVARHVRESIEPARWLATLGASRWLDFGSGAGFPAIPLAIAGIGRHWILVESRRPKSLFMRKATAELALEDFVKVRHSRLEEVCGSIEPVHVFTARATYRIGPTLSAAADLVVAGGSAVLWKGSGWRDELAKDSGWKENWVLAESNAVGSGQSAVVRFVRS